MQKSGQKLSDNARREKSKIRSRQHRKRKKDYISELEFKNKQLESKITELQNEISYYKSLVTVKKVGLGENDEEIKFIEDEDFGFKELGSLFKRDPGLVKMTMIDHLWQSVGTNSQVRKKILNNAFKDIIKYILPDDYRIAFALNENIDRTRFDLIKTIAKCPKYK